MRILYLITKSELGGAQTHVLQLVEHFSKQGHQIAVMAYPGGPLQQQVQLAGALFYPNHFFSNSYNPIRLISAIRTIQKTVRSFNPDLVHCHSSVAGFLGRLVVRNKIPTIFTAHSWAFTKGAPLIRKIVMLIAEKTVARYASKIICVSSFDRNSALHYGFTPHKLVVIYNGVPIKETQYFHRENDQITILFLGRLAYPKNPFLLVEAFALLPQDLKIKTRVLIVGEGPQAEDLDKYIKTKGLEKRIFLKEAVTHDKAIKIMYESDLFVLISKHEGLPMTILEAMSSGLPVVASKVGGIPELVEETCGMLIEKNNLEILAAALKILLENNEKRILLGKKGYERVLEHFSLELFLKRTQAVYDEVLSGKKFF